MTQKEASQKLEADCPGARGWGGLQQDSAIIQRENQEDFWHKLNYVKGKKKTRSATAIQVKGQGGVIIDALHRTPLSSQSLARYTKNDTLLQERPLFAMAHSFKTLGTPQAHPHPEQSLMALTWHQKTRIRPQKSFLPKLQPFVNWYHKIQYLSQSRHNNGNSTGRLWTKRRCHKSQVSTSGTT